MTPQEIAKQAAAQIIDRRDSWCAGGSNAPYFGQAEAAALILSAAAKMVRETGAVEALEESTQLLDEAAEPDKNPLAAEWDRVACARVRSNAAALQSLRSLTEHKGEPQ